MKKRKRIAQAIIGAWYLGSLTSIFIGLVGKTPESTEPYTFWDMIMVLIVFYITHVAIKWIEDVFHEHKL